MIGWLKRRFNQSKTVDLSVLDQAYAGINGFLLSKQDRASLGIDGYEWVYGEMPCYTVVDILCVIQPQLRMDVPLTVYDLGSGIGQVLLTTILVLPVKRAVGYERLPALAAASELAWQRLQSAPDYALRCQHTTFEIKRADYVDADLQQADLIFLNATGLFAEAWEAMQARLLQTRSGTWVVLTSRTLPAPEMQLIDAGWRLMSWGMNRVFVYLKT